MREAVVRVRELVFALLSEMEVVQRNEFREREREDRDVRSCWRICVPSGPGLKCLLRAAFWETQPLFAHSQALTPGTSKYR